MISVDTRVIILKTSAYVGRRGVVTRVDPLGVWVVLDGHRKAMAFASFEVVKEEESTPHMVAGE